MSGGHFQYNQYRITQIADEIEDLIFHNGSQELNEYGDLAHQEYDQDIIESFRVAVSKLREAAVYAHRIDWLVSGDDGEDSFRTRLRDDLESLK